jgi:hypothetical protein
MGRIKGAAISVAVVSICAQAGLAQRTLQFDVNNLAFQAENSGGVAVPFGGVTHTGSLNLSDSLPTSQLLGIGISTAGGPFVDQPGAPWNLTDFVLNITLNNGNVTGGQFSIDVNGGPSAGGDRYSATVGSGGAVTPFVGGGFKVEGLTMAGHFSDSSFGPVDVSDFFAAPSLGGSFLTFRIQPNSTGGGYADTDAFVTPVPQPAGSLALVAAGMMVARRRRR